MTTDFHGFPPFPNGHHGRGIGALIAAVAAGSTLLDNLVSWWDLDETSGTREDAVGSNDLTDINTVLYTDGKIGNAATFVSANNEYLEKTGFVVSDSWTVSGWVKGNGISQAGDGWVGAYNTWASAVQFQVYAGAPNVAYALVGDDAGAYKFVQAYIGATAPNFGDVDWFHFCAWFDASDKIVHMVLNDGIEYVSAAALVGAPYRTAAPLDFSGKPAALDGHLDMVGYWNRVLTDAERTELYNLGAGIKNTFTDNGEGFREDLVNHWKLEETSGTRADELGSLTLTDNNTVTSGTGKDGTAAFFDDANSEHLSVSDGAGTVWGESGTGCSFSFWWNPSATGTGYGQLFGRGWTAGRPIELVTETGSLARLYGRVEAGGAVQSTITGPFSTGTWYHIVMTYDPGDKKHRTYVDAAAPVVSTATVNSSLDTTTADFEIGGGSGGVGFINGFIDDMMIWDRPLSADEITALYAAGAGRFYDFQV